MSTHAQIAIAKKVMTLARRGLSHGFLRDVAIRVVTTEFEAKGWTSILFSIYNTDYEHYGNEMKTNVKIAVRILDND